MSKRKISIKSAKAKGRRLQQYVANKIAEVTGLEVEKDGDIEPRQMGMGGVDVILRGEALEKFPFAIECKNSEKWSIVSAINQAKANQKDKTEWMLVLSKNHFNPIVVLDAEVFFRIYKSVIDNDDYFDVVGE